MRLLDDLQEVGAGESSLAGFEVIGLDIAPKITFPEWLGMQMIKVLRIARSA